MTTRIYLVGSICRNIRRKIGMVFQDFRLLANRTAYENIAFAMEVAGGTNEEISQDVPQVLEVVGLAEKEIIFRISYPAAKNKEWRLPGRLIHRPSVILADEPTGNLDFIKHLGYYQIAFENQRAWHDR